MGSSAHIPRKRFGQNFLTDASIIQQLLSIIYPEPHHLLVEIGPGLGALTDPLLKLLPHLWAIELDRHLAAKLEARYAHTQKLTLYSADALTFDFDTIPRQPQQKVRIVGNLPYNISTPLIFHLLNFGSLIQDMHFMLQKEVVDRLTATSGQKSYGKLSIMVQYFCQTAALLSVPPTAFRPEPKVTSAFIRLTPYPSSPYGPVNTQRLHRITTDAFNQRRKTLQNSLKAHLSHSDFLTLNIQPKLRAEQLTISDFVKITNYLEDKN